MTAYYNENDKYAAQWLRNLIAEGHIAPGDVDDRSIVDVRADDLRGYTQCHFFAGIGGWSYAVRLAGWDDSRSVWTGSCPCQPFSAAGKGKAADDERHLWPAWFSLIRECKPAIIFGEQVEAAIGWGWLDAVFSDLEKEGYACGATALPACGVGAPHIRQRLWFVGFSSGDELGRLSRSASGTQAEGESSRQVTGTGCLVPGSTSAIGELADNNSCRQLVADDARERGTRDQQEQFKRNGPFGELADDNERGRKVVGETRLHENGQSGNDTTRRRAALSVADALSAGWPEGRTIAGHGSTASSSSAGELADADSGQPWQDCIWLPCTDGKARPVEPGIQPLAYGIPSRVGRLRAYGNAIVPQVAAEFIKATMT